jgi:putative phosphoesterase
MLIGILSDTHDRVETMKLAVALLKNAGAEFFIHCGDVGGTGVLDHLAGLKAVFVWGNTDWDRLPLQRYAQGLGIACYGSMGDIQLDGKRIAVLHGDDAALMQKLLVGQQYDYLFHGHTHVRRDERIGKTRVINPGALQRAKEKSVALLDSTSDQLRFLIVGGGNGGLQ